MEAITAMANTILNTRRPSVVASVLTSRLLPAQSTAALSVRGHVPCAILRSRRVERRPELDREAYNPAEMKGSATESRPRAAIANLGCKVNLAEMGAVERMLLGRGAQLVDLEHRLGNIRETPLGELLNSPALRAFGDAKRDALPRYCRECEVLAMCHGGCPKYRFIRTPAGEPGLNYLCAGLKRFFLHSRAPIERIASQGREVPGPRSAAANAGRNDPCPCGSGLKFKKCCAAR